MATSALKRIRLGKYPCITTSDTPPHGRCTLSPAKRQAIREYAEGIAVIAMIAIVALLLLAVGGCSAAKTAAKAYASATIDNHALILPDYAAYLHADPDIDARARESRLELVASQQRLDAIYGPASGDSPSPEYCTATITRHSMILPEVRSYYEADAALTGGTLRARTLLIEEQQRLDAQWQLDFGTPTPPTAPTAPDPQPGVNSNGQSPAARPASADAGLRRLTHLGGIRGTQASASRCGAHPAGNRGHRLRPGESRGQARQQDHRMAQTLDRDRDRDGRGAQHGPGGALATGRAATGGGPAHRRHQWRGPAPSLALSAIGIVFHDPRGHGFARLHPVALRRTFHWDTDEALVSVRPRATHGRGAASASESISPANKTPVSGPRSVRVTVQRGQMQRPGRPRSRPGLLAYRPFPSA